ncbi:MAG TPA: PH domain-containing protein [Thermoanaerobaculia bacterium]|nr:PH domain-containing protein [Thermoanaerobaculia bacterium]
MRERILRLLKVPEAPDAPAGENPRLFRAARAFFTYKAMAWGAAQIFAVVGLIFGLIGLRVLETRLGDARWVSILGIIEVLAWMSVLLQIPLGFMIMRFDYELRWYIVTDRSLRIREGITTITEKTMTFRNIQNIAIRQGPLQRMFGIADLEVRSAGGGGSSGPEKHNQPGDDLHVAFFRGVDNAEEIRNLIRERVRLHRDTGLGDPDEREKKSESSAEMDAATRLLDEARALRRVMSGAAGS